MAVEIALSHRTVGNLFVRVAAVQVLAAGVMLAISSLTFPMGRNFSTIAVGLGVFEVGIAYHLWRDSQFYAARLKSRSLVASVLRSVCALMAIRAFLNAANSALGLAFLQSAGASPQGGPQVWNWLPFALTVGGFFLASPLAHWIESRLIGDEEIREALDGRP